MARPYRGFHVARGFHEQDSSGDSAEEEEFRRERPRRGLQDAQNAMEVYDDSQFKKRYRFSKLHVRDLLLPLVDAPLRNETNRGLPLPLLLQLLIVLRFYATGSFQIVCADLFGVSQSCVSKVVKRVSSALVTHLGNYIKLPRTPAETRDTWWKFHAIAQFPGVTGCIDCTHIRIENPGGPTAETYRNRKRYFSINVQVVAGPNMEILDIVARWPGSSHDSTIFQGSGLRVRLEEGQVQPLVLGDSGYPFREYLFTPLLNPVTEAEERYNNAHKSTRNIVERVFGVWKKRFPCLRKGLGNRSNTCTKIIVATAILHNISRAVGDVEDFSDDEDDGAVPVRHVQQEQNANGMLLRQAFIARHFQ